MAKTTSQGPRFNPVEHAVFLVRQRMIGFEVPDVPHFDSEESTRWFLDQLAECDRYLEYGSGGSTFVAAKLGVDTVTVESDRYFLDAVEQKIHEAGLSHTGQVFRHVDIGRVGPWGRPRGKMTDERFDAFRRYSDVPAERARADQLPDLVLVDGRFRVACTLKVLSLMADAAPGWQIVVDDYTDHPEYAVLAEFSELHLVGRMAVLTAIKPLAADHLADEISRWETATD